MAGGAGSADRADARTDRIVFLGHASVLLELAGVRLLTDPLLRHRVVHLRRQVPPVGESATTSLDAVLISHLHHDHLDLASLRLLGAGTPLLVPAGAGAWLARRGFASVTELREGQGTEVGAVTVTAVRASHDGRRFPRGPSAPSLGYLVSAPDGARAIYFAGDTELFAQMAALAGRVDVALVPVAGWGPKLGPGHMDPLDAARAVRLIAPRIAIPVHWGTLLPLGYGRRHRPHLGDPARRFAQHVAELAPDVEVRVLAPGAQTAL